MRDENENTAIVNGLMEGDDQPLIENLLDIHNSLDGSETSSDIEKKDNLSSTTDDSEENNNDKNEKNIKLSYLDSNGLFKNDENSFNIFKSDDFVDDDTILIMPGDAKLEKEDPGVVNPVYLNEDDDLVKGDGSVGTPSDRSSPNPTPPESPMDRSTNSLQGSPISYRSHMGTQSHRSSISSVRKKGILKKCGSTSTIYGGMEMGDLTSSRCVSRNGSFKGKEAYEDEYSQDDTNKFISSDNDYDVQQTTKSLGGHRVKFILETGRPDFVSGSYDDIGIEKKELERIDRIEKGRSLDVTNNENEKGGRKCMIFLGLMFLLAGAIIVGALYGSGRIGNITKYGKGISSNIIINNPSSSSANVATTPAPTVYVKNTFEVKFELDAIKFAPPLADHASEDFKSLTAILEEKLRAPISYKYDEHFTLKLIKFESSDSNATSSTVRIRWPDSDKNSTNSPTIKDITAQLEQYINVREGHIGGHHIRSKSLNVEDLIDECRDKERTTCSHICDFQTTTLMFKCSCPDNLILQDKSKCVDRSSVKPTEKPKPVNIANILEKAQAAGGVVTDLRYENKKTTTTTTSTEKPTTTTITAITTSITTINESDSTTPISIDLRNNDTHIPIVSIDETGTLLEASNSTKNSTDQTTVNELDLINEIDTESNNGSIIEKDSSHKKDKSHLNPDKLDSKYSLEDIQSPGTRMEDIASFNMSSENPQNLSSLLFGDSPGDGRLQNMNNSYNSFINDNTGNASSLSNTSNITKEPLIFGQVNETNISYVFENDKALNMTKTASMGNMTNLISPHENITVEKELDENIEAVFLSNDTLIVNKTSNPEKEVIVDIINEISEATTPKAVLFDSISNDTEHDFINETTENTITNLVVSTIVDDMKGNTTNLTSTLKNVTNELAEITDSPPNVVTVTVTATPYYEPNHANKTPPKYANKTSTSTISTTQVVPLISETTESIQSVDELVDQNVTDINELLYLDNINPDSVTTSRPINIKSDTQDKTLILSKVNITESIGDKSINSSIPVYPDVSFKNESHILLKIDSDVETTTILSIISSTNFRASCKEGMMPCTNGTDCILKASKCNGFIDCQDSSDEFSCKENDCFSNFKCSTGECLDRSLVCNGISDCDLADDESNCETWSCTSDEFHCNNTALSMCIPLSLKCDGNPDCADHSDEFGCLPENESKCGEESQFLCPEGWCIPNTYKCDGHSHCKNGEDEADCKCSGEDETECNVGGCVSKFRLCDGHRNCPDGSDEWNCLRIQNTTGRLEVRKGETIWYAVCGDDWNNEWSDLACQQLGGVKRLTTNVTALDEMEIPPPFVRLDSTINHPNVPMQYALRTDEECTGNTFITLSCEYENTCSSWENESANRTARLNGDNVRDGELPSLVKLVLQRKPNETHLCTAIVVTSTWVLTSYSCISANGEAVTPNGWSVIAGDSSPTLREKDTRTSPVLKIQKYPGTIRVGGIWRGDAALLHLKTPLTINTTVSQACLSEKSPLPTDQCIIAGWSAKSNSQQPAGIERHLEKVHLGIISSDICNTTHYPSRISDMHMCAEMNDTEDDICNENSGSPMMCRDSSNVLRLHGILSGHVGCRNKQNPLIFTAIHKLEPWLSSTIGITQNALLKPDTEVPITVVPEVLPPTLATHNNETQESLTKYTNVSQPFKPSLEHNNVIQPSSVTLSNATDPSKTVIVYSSESQPVDTENNVNKQDVFLNETEKLIGSTTSKHMSMHEHNSSKLRSEETTS